MSATTTPAPAYAVIKTVAALYPEFIPLLEGRARWIAVAATAPMDEVKTEEQYLTRLVSLVRRLYAGEIGGGFVDEMAALLSRQIFLAHRQAWRDEDGKGDIPDYLQENADEMILSEFDFVDAYYQDILAARLDELPIEPLLARAELWANRYNDAYNVAILLIAAENGGKLEWKFGDAEHCDTCRELDGMVLFATEWQELGVVPQNPPNALLKCGGWQCQCSLNVTDKRRTPKGFAQVLNIIETTRK
jgi:hypothetical protein